MGGSPPRRQPKLAPRAATPEADEASLTTCVRLPHQTVPGRPRQKVPTFATATPLQLELRHWLVCHGGPRCFRAPAAMDPLWPQTKGRIGSGEPFRRHARAPVRGLLPRRLVVRQGVAACHCHRCRVRGCALGPGYDRGLCLDAAGLAVSRLDHCGHHHPPAERLIARRPGLHRPGSGRVSGGGAVRPPGAPAAGAAIGQRGPGPRWLPTRRPAKSRPPAGTGLRDRGVQVRAPSGTANRRASQPAPKACEFRRPGQAPQEGPLSPPKQEK